MNIPAGLKYTNDHEWTKVDGKRAIIGVTAFAVEQLGDITLVNVDAKVGDKIEAGKAVGTIESVKTLSDIFAPVSGKLVEVNKALADHPELVNEDCYGKGWMVAIELDDQSAVDKLMDEKAYGEHVKASAH